MKSMIAAPRSGVPIENAKDYPIISISLNGLLLAVFLIATFELNKARKTALSP